MFPDSSAYVSSHPSFANTTDIPPSSTFESSFTLLSRDPIDRCKSNTDSLPLRPPQLGRPRPRISPNLLLRRDHWLPGNLRINPHLKSLLKRLLHHPILPTMKADDGRPAAASHNLGNHRQQSLQIRQLPIHHHPQNLKRPRRRMQFRPCRALQRKSP